MTHPLQKHKPYARYLATLSCLWGTFACTPAQQREDKPPRTQSNKASLVRVPAATPPAKKLTATPKSSPTLGNQCPRFSSPARIGTIKQPQLNELSGLSSSRRDPSIFWTHNDSGGAPRLYALDSEARLRGTVELPVQAVDWEDIAVGESHTGTPQLYIADSGDNHSKRAHITIHRITEPTLTSNVTNLRLRTRNVESMKLRYPDGPRDAEALFVDPLDGALYLFTKPRLGWPKLYSVPEFKPTATLEPGPRLSPLATSQALHWVTAADISRDGRWIALRTYNQLVLFSRLPGMTVTEALNTPACVLTPPDEQQGEAVCFAFQQSGAPSPPSLHTVSEGLPSALFQLSPQEPNQLQ